MVILLAKNQLEGQYYFRDSDDSDDGAVYRIKLPLEDSVAEFMDYVPTFWRRIMDTDIVQEVKEFESLVALRAFAIQDCAPEKRGVVLKDNESYDDLLMFAPREVAEDRLNMIKTMIEKGDFTGFSQFFRQLRQCRALVENKDLLNTLELLELLYDKTRFSDKSDGLSSIKPLIFWEA
jgi:hypothetical protein